MWAVLGDAGEYHHCENFSARRVIGNRLDRAWRGRDLRREDEANVS